MKIITKSLSQTTAGDCSKRVGQNADIVNNVTSPICPSCPPGPSRCHRTWTSILYKGAGSHLLGCEGNHKRQSTKSKLYTPQSDDNVKVFTNAIDPTAQCPHAQIVNNITSGVDHPSLIAMERVGPKVDFRMHIRIACRLSSCEGNHKHQLVEGKLRFSPVQRKCEIHHRLYRINTLHPAPEIVKKITSCGDQPGPREADGIESRWT